MEGPPVWCGTCSVVPYTDVLGFGGSNIAPGGMLLPDSCVFSIRCWLEASRSDQKRDRTSTCTWHSSTKGHKLYNTTKKDWSSYSRSKAKVQMELRRGKQCISNGCAWLTAAWRSCFLRTYVSNPTQKHCVRYWTAILRLVSMLYVYAVYQVSLVLACVAERKVGGGVHGRCVFDGFHRKAFTVTCSCLLFAVCTKYITSDLEGLSQPCQVVKS